MKKLIFLICCSSLTCYGQQYILDSDTGNEIDDLYAIVYAVAVPGMDIISLNSAQFNSVQMVIDGAWSGNKVADFVTVNESQRLNEKLLQALKRMDIPSLMGAKNHLGYAWGYYETAPIPESPASEFIIAQAEIASPENKLNVICIGASTNLAAAIEKKPVIAKNIHAYLLGAQFDTLNNAWNKSEFNIQRDLNAFDALLNKTDLEMSIMPISTARPFVFEKTKTLERLYQNNNEVTDQLADRWTYMNAEELRVMWDLALVIAINQPEMATLEKRPAPPENKREMVQVYTKIDTEKMYSEFWRVIAEYLEE